MAAQCTEAWLRPNQLRALLTGKRQHFTAVLAPKYPSHILCSWIFALRKFIAHVPNTGVHPSQSYLKPKDTLLLCIHRPTSFQTSFPCFYSLCRAIHHGCNSQHKIFQVFPLLLYILILFHDTTILHIHFFSKCRSWTLSYEERIAKRILLQRSSKHAGFWQQHATEIKGCYYINYTINYVFCSFKNRCFLLQAKKIS